MSGNAIVFLILISISFGGGWSVSDWKNGTEITQLKADKKELEGKIETQNESVTKLETESEERKSNQDAALKGAEKQIKKMQEDIARLKGLTVTTCYDAENLINSELGL